MKPDFNAMKKFARQRMSQDRSGHSFDHVQRVVNMTCKLLQQTPQADPLITKSAAYLHDTIDDKLVNDPAKAQQDLINKLKQWYYSTGQINKIMLIITHMSFSDNLQHHYHLPVEGQLVQDADRLDAIGAIGIARAFCFGGHVGEKMYDPKLKPRIHMTKAKERNYTQGTTINHFYEKLLKIKDDLNTAAAKQLAQGRQEVMIRFLREFKNEWNGKE
ncbi:HD domain-containing protein [uncultured bacterium]|nr:HD domain-containing protein [uncultured bacterium]